MKKYALLMLWLLVSSSFLACGEVTERNPQVKSEPHDIATELLINLTSDPMTDPHSGLMGMHLAQKALKGGKEVTIFLNVHGVKLLSAEADSLQFHEENLKEVMMQIVADGGAVRACPHCMEVHGLSKQDLPDGILMMEEKLMLEKLDAHLTVFTY